MIFLSSNGHVSSLVYIAMPILVYTVFESTGWRMKKRPGATCNINTARAGFCTPPCINIFLIRVNLIREHSVWFYF